MHAMIKKGPQLETWTPLPPHVKDNETSKTRFYILPAASSHGPEVKLKGGGE